MFGRKAAAKIGHDVLHRLDHRVVKCRIVAGGQRGVMQVAIPQMRHDKVARAGVELLQFRLDPLQKSRHAIQRQRDVGVDGDARRIGDLCRRLAPFPDRAALFAGCGDHRIVDGPVFQHRFQRFGQKLGQGQAAIGVRDRVARGGRAQFDQDRDRVNIGQVQPKVGPRGDELPLIGVGHVFEGLDHAAAGLLHLVQEHQRIVQRLHPQNRRHPRLRGGDKLQRRGGDDGQRPLRADQKVAQVIAGIVLVQRPHQVQHPPVGQNRLDPKAERAGIAIAQDVRSPGIGGQHAPDGGRSARAEPKREVQPVFRRPVVQGGKDHPRLGYGHPRGGAQVTDAVHPFQRQHHLALGMRGAGQAGTSARRNNGDAGRIGMAEDGRDLLCRGGTQDGAGLARVISGRVDAVAGGIRAGQHMRLAENGGKCRDHIRHLIPPA